MQKLESAKSDFNSLTAKFGEKTSQLKAALKSNELLKVQLEVSSVLLIDVCDYSAYKLCTLTCGFLDESHEFRVCSLHRNISNNW